MKYQFSVDSVLDDSIKSGEYIATITDAEIKPNSQPTGSHLQLVFTICQGQFKGFPVKKWLNTEHNDEQPRRIARKQLGTLLVALHMKDMDDTDELLGQPVKIKLKVTSKNAYPEITDWSPVDPGPQQSPPPVAATQTTQTGEPAQPTPAPAPWKR